MYQILKILFLFYKRRNIGKKDFIESILKNLGKFILLSTLLGSSYVLGHQIIRYDTDMIYKITGFVFITAIALNLTYQIFIKQFNTIKLLPFLVMPIQKKTIFFYFSLNFYFSFSNFCFITFLSIFIFPFIQNTYGIFFFSAAFFTVILISIASSFIAIYLKLSKPLNRLLYFLLLAFIICITICYYKKNEFSLQTLIHFTIININILLIALIILATIFSLISYKVFCCALYNQGILGNKVIKLPYLKIRSKNTDNRMKKSDLLNYILLESKLLLRNKRTRGLLRSVTLINILFSLYMTSLKLDIYLYIWYSLFLLTSYGLIIGQYMISLESSYFDFLLTHNINYNNFFLAKYYVYSSLDFIAFIILTINAYFFNKNIITLLLLFFYSLGVNNFLILYNSTFNNSKIDLQENSFNNWNGTKQNNFILAIVSMLPPMIILYFTEKIIPIEWAIRLLGLLGFCFILFHRIWIAHIANISKHKLIQKSDFFHNK